jgi:hypothetical protein
MKISGPDKYELKIEDNNFIVVDNENLDKFSEKSSSKIPKLYIASYHGVPIYVGITKQPIRNRLRYGFKASGKGGYHGYAWAKGLKKVNFYVWYDEDDSKRKCLDIETIEAELVYMIRRKYGQWPKYQTEIHFHASNNHHRGIAKRIFGIFIKNKNLI